MKKIWPHCSLHKLCQVEFRLTNKVDHQQQTGTVVDQHCLHFDIKDMGRLHYFLGMKVIQNEESNEIWIGQPAYTQNLFQKFGMENAKAVKTPVDMSVKLVKAIESECSARDFLTSFSRFSPFAASTMSSTYTPMKNVSPAEDARVTISLNKTHFL